jgi:serine protease Do
MTGKTLIRNPLLAAALGAAAVAAPGAAYFYSTAPHAEQTPAVVAANATPAPAAVTVRNGLPDFSSLVKAYGPAVVNISVKANVKTAAQLPQLPGFGPDDPFSQFFRGFPGPRGSVPVHGEGSGFIIKPDGTILTNAHVVADATNVTVKLTDRREYEAKVVGVDEKTDVAVIKIDAKDLPVVHFGQGDNVQVGQWVVAIGAPFGFDNSVTAGIVSAKGRTLPDGSYVPFLQTDVAINPGNSGGPLFNLDGDVIGINSQIYSRSGGYEGVSFAIPIDVALDVSRQLQANGKVSRGKLGVGIQELDQKLADSFGLDTPRGALVSSVEDEGPAAKAGLEAGDVILEFDGPPDRRGVRAAGRGCANRAWQERRTQGLAQERREGIQAQARRARRNPGGDGRRRATRGGPPRPGGSAADVRRAQTGRRQRRPADRGRAGRGRGRGSQTWRHRAVRERARGRQRAGPAQAGRRRQGPRCATGAARRRAHLRAS